MHVVITGASSGIGRALALEYGRAGASLTLVARRRELLESLARQVGRPCHLVVQDLSERDRLADWIPDAEVVNGPIDVLVNNAGVAHFGATAALSPELGQQILDVCLTAPLVLTREVLPGMIARGSGTIVQVASMAAVVVPPGGTWYGAAKAGFAAFSEAVRQEIKGTGVNMLTVYPGPVATPLADVGYAAYAENKIVESLPEGTPEELATRIRRAVERRSARLIYPRFYGMTRALPGFARWFTNAFRPELRAAPEAAKPAVTAEVRP